MAAVAADNAVPELYKKLRRVKMGKIAQMSQNKRRFVAAVCAFFAVFAAGSFNWLQSYRFAALPIMLGTGVFYYWVIPFLSGRRAIFAFLGGGLFALCHAIGAAMDGAKSMLYIPVLALCFLPMYAALVCTAFLLLEKGQNPQPFAAKSAAFVPAKARGFFAWLLSGRAKPTAFLFLMLVMWWFLFYYMFYPGLATPDTVHQINMALGHMPFTSHHAPLHTLWLGFCLRLGLAAFGNYGAGVALASGMQMLLLAGLVCATLAYMARFGLAFAPRFAAFLFYFLCPVHGWYAVTLWKDIWLAAFSLLFTICLLDISKNREQFFKKWIKVFVFLFAVLGLITSKNNGIYLFLIAGTAMFFAIKQTKKQMAAVLLFGLLANGLISGPLYGALGIQKGSIREALSLPLLQIAIVVRDAPNTISPKDKASIANLLPYYSELGQRYNPRISDSVKDGFNDGVFAQNKGEYLRLYLRLFAQNPKLYLRAFLEHTYAYYYPDNVFFDLATTSYPGYLSQAEESFVSFDSMAGKYPQPHKALQEWVFTRSDKVFLVPGYALLFNCGFYYCAMLFCGLYVCYKKCHTKLLALALPFALWLTCLASPVNGSYRYSYPAVLAAPLIVGYMLFYSPKECLREGTCG